jgi:hypothetical protein
VKKKQKRDTKQTPQEPVAWGFEEEPDWPRPTTLKVFNLGSPPDWLEAAQEANEAISRAEYFGDFSVLTGRLRKGIASREEMVIAANYIDGKYKPEKRNRGGQPTAGFNRSLHITNYVTRLVKSGKSKKAAVSFAAEEFNLSEPRIYAALKDVAGVDGVTNILIRGIFGF